MSSTSRFAALQGFNLRVFVVGSTLSYVGSFVQMFAQSWLVLSITGDRASLPYSIGLSTLPLLLFGTWGGSVVDRLDNRRLMMFTTTANATLALVLAVLVQRGQISVGAVYIVATVSGFVSVFERPAMQAVLSELAPPEHITSAVALNAMVFPIARLLGPPLASLVIAASSIAACFYVNAASYLFFFAALLLLRRRDMIARVARCPRKGMVTAGLRYARHNPVVGPVLLGMFFVGLAGFNFTTVMPLMAKYTFHVSEGRLSVPLSLSAVGSIAAGIAVAGLKRPTIRWLGVCAVSFGVLLAMYGGAPSYLGWVLVSLPVGFAATVYTTMVTQLLQKSSRPDMLGRVMALYGIAFLGTTPLGALCVALLSTSFSTRAPFLVGGTVVFLTGVATLVFVTRSRLSTTDAVAG